MNAKKIIEALEAKGFTRYRIAKETGISNQCLGHWVSGKRTPDLDSKKTCEKIAKLGALNEKS